MNREGHDVYYLEKKTPISHGEAIFMGILLESEMSDLTFIEKVDIKNYPGVFKFKHNIWILSSKNAN